MATLIGRECWHVAAQLSGGKIVEHMPHIPAVVILRGDGQRLTVHASSALLTLEAAIHEAEEAAEYFEQKVRDLKALRDLRDTKPFRPSLADIHDCDCNCSPHKRTCAIYRTNAATSTTTRHK